ncbi:MAG: hypothetical protein NTX86_05740 [Candidatus Dependentiae bacterium]|nr:hypothetical protein [Candidatus Dependentiae bacterium]
MELKRWGIRLATLVVVVVLCAFGVQKMHQAVVAHQRMLVSVDPLIAQETQESIAAFATTQPHTPASEFIELLVKNFPSIKSVEYSYDASGLLCYTVESALPLFSINNDYVLTDKGALVPKKDFVSHLVQSLHNITLSSDVISDAFTACIQSLPQSFFESYDVVWLNDYEVVLYDKAQPGFSICFNTQVVPELSMIERCNAIKNDLASAGLFEKKVHAAAQKWVADIRFKNQIIVSANVGGRHYG